MSHPFDLVILDAGAKGQAGVYARCGMDVALASLPLGAKFKQLVTFRQRMYVALLKNQPRPSKSELTKFGRELFELVIRGDVKRLYDRLTPGDLVRIHILTNRPELQSMPWEYLQDPKQGPGPSVERSIVRIVPTIGRVPPVPLALVAGGPKIRILFVYADPANQNPVSWPSVRASIEDVFAARIPADRYELKVIQGTAHEMFEAFQTGTGKYDILQFSGHGDINNKGEGRLLLLSKDGQKTAPLDASEVANLLAGRGIRLAVLSACLTAAGDSADPFNVIAESLIIAGIPAVVANLLPVPDASVAAFVGALYAQLLTSGDIDMAVNQGRIKLAVELAVPPLATLEWGIPTLYRHMGGAQIFQP